MKEIGVHKYLQNSYDPQVMLVHSRREVLGKRGACKPADPVGNGASWKQTTYCLLRWWHLHVIHNSNFTISK